MKIISSAAIALATGAASASEASVVTRLRNTNVHNYKSLVFSASATTTTVRRDQSTLGVASTAIEDAVGSLSLSFSFNDADGLTSTTAPAAATTTSVAPTVTPTNLYICGVDYADASTNFCTNPTCPTGDVSLCVCVVCVMCVW